MYVYMSAKDRQEQNKARSGLKVAGLLASSSMMVIMSLTGAQAQTQAASSNDQTIEDVVVTGTALRGVAPAGAEVLGVDASQITAMGALTAEDVLSNIPQTSNFGEQESINPTLPINRPALRNTLSSSGGLSPTLILVDGHRIPGSGTTTTIPDPDVVPASLIERVEVVPDGGSAIYGSDAIGGVINFITKKDFDGIEVDGHFGVGDSYTSETASVTGGISWAGGSAYAGYSYSNSDSIYGRDRGYVKSINWVTGLPTGRQCPDPSVQVAGSPTYYNFPGPVTSATPNTCDNSQVSTLFPRMTTHSVFAGVTQEITSSLEFDMRAYFTQRTTQGDSGPLAPSAAVTVTPASPYYMTALGGASQSVNFAIGQHTYNGTVEEVYGAVPTLTWKIGGDWQMTAFANVGQSITTTNTPTIYQSELNTLIGNGSFDPYNYALSNANALSGISSYETYARGKDTLLNSRVVFDGPLVTLPGGEVRLAVGMEASRELFDQWSSGNADLNGAGNFINTDPSAILAADPSAVLAHPCPPPQTGHMCGNLFTESLIPRASDSRNVWAAFAEANVPLVGPNNELPLVHSLSLSLAGRFDSYGSAVSDPGSHSFVPQLGASYEPVDWIHVHSRWGKSFQVPSLPSLLTPTGITAGNLATISIFNDPASPATGTNGYLVLLTGVDGHLKPQTSESWDIGFDVDPPFVPGLTLGATYYRLVLQNQIKQALVAGSVRYLSPTLGVLFPSQAQWIQFAQARGVTADQISNARSELGCANPTVLADMTSCNSVYGATTIAISNFAQINTDGIDLNVGYTHDTGFGSMFLNASGTYVMEDDVLVNGQLASKGAGALNQGIPRYNVSTTVGANVGQHITTQLTWNHSAGFNITPNAQNLFQSSVRGFDLVNYSFSYAFDGADYWDKDLTLTFNVNNLFDTDPPVERAAGQSTNGSVGTLGRVFQIGLSKKF